MKDFGNANLFRGDRNLFKYFLAALIAVLSLTGPNAMEAQAHHGHRCNGSGGYFGGYGYGGGTIIDRLVGNAYGGGYGGNRLFGYNGFYPGNSYFGHHHHRGWCGGGRRHHCDRYGD